MSQGRPGLCPTQVPREGKHRRGPQRAARQSRRPRVRPGSAAPAPPSSPLRSSRPPPHWELRAARPREAGAGREGPRSPPPAAGAAPSQGDSPPPPPPPRLPPGHRQPSWRRADAEPLPRGRHRGRSPSPLRLPRPWGASGAGPALASPRPAPPTSLRLRPSGLRVPRVVGDSEAARCGGQLSTVARLPTPALRPRAPRTLSSQASAPAAPAAFPYSRSSGRCLRSLALWPSLPTERSRGLTHRLARSQAGG